MGSFAGHSLPGSFFWMYGVWVLINCYYILLRNRLQKQNINVYKTAKSKLKPNNISNNDGHENVDLESFDSKNSLDNSNFCLPDQSSFKLKMCGKVLPIESIAKVICSTFGMGVEGLGFIWGYPAMYQHFTMYSIFCLCGVVEIFLHCRLPIPHKMDFMLNIFAFMVEGVLFAFHLHGRSHLDVTIHTLLVYSCFFCSFAVFLTMIQPQNPAFRILVGIGALLQGSWFWQAGAILYPLINSKWNETEHHNVMITVMLFCWHIIFDSIFALLLYCLMSRCVRSCSNCNALSLIGDYEIYMTTYQNSNNRYFKLTSTNEQTSNLLDSNDEEEGDVEKVENTNNDDDDILDSNNSKTTLL